MSPWHRFIGTTLVGLALLMIGSSAHAQTSKLTVLATDVIYAAGTQSALAATYGGTIPQAVVNLPPGTTGVYLTSVRGSIQCVSAAGCISLASGNFANDPDGVNCCFNFSGGGSGGISGISGPGVGFLVGVFLAAGGPVGAPPAALNFNNRSRSATAGHPKLDQVFFLGDGLTGDGTGTHQVAKVPLGASQLVLGIADAPNFSAANPGDYGDNQGFYSVGYGLTK